VEARRKKIALYLDGNPALLLQLELDQKLLPQMLAVLTLTHDISAMFHAIWYSSKASIPKVMPPSVDATY
jgi:predicted KAP-like P-loop ATPase